MTLEIYINVGRTNMLLQKRKCWQCDNPAEVVSDYYKGIYFDEKLIATNPINPNSIRCYCRKCAKEKDETYNKELKEYIRIKKKIMFERAVRTLEHQNVSIEKFKDSIKVVEGFLSENPDKFDSSYEVLAAIILVQNRIHCKMQYRAGKYQVDFLLDEMFVVLEIDGERHSTNKAKEKDRERDIFIRKELGNEWEIVRIKTEYLDQHAIHLVEAIKEVLDYRSFGGYKNK